MAALENRHPASHDDHWIPLSDLMTGLMMIFLLISIVYMVKIEADTKLIRQANADTRQITAVYEAIKQDLYNDLHNEFKSDLPKWGAELLSDSTIRFKAPDVLFDSGRADLKARFKSILEDFFPRYLTILTSKKYRDSIREVRIEGHTSSFWQSARTEQEAYIQNMQLSQDRTRSTLEYLMLLPAVEQYLEWLRAHVTANGLSYSKRIFKADGSEDYARSQRVEFRVRTDAESRIEKIVEAAK